MGDLGPDTSEDNPYKADEDAARARAAGRKSKREAPAPPPKTVADREAEDLQVAEFYQSGGNFRGAYLRAKDAVALAADNPDAHLALGEAARKLGKLDEAEGEFKACLKLDPVPKTKHSAEKALKEMAGGG
jgi:Tfp pilus assembly protein PilF